MGIKKWWWGDEGLENNIIKDRLCSVFLLIFKKLRI